MGLAEAWADRAALRMGFDVARLDGRNQLRSAPAMTGFSALRGIMPPGAAIGLIFAEKNTKHATRGAGAHHPSGGDDIIPVGAKTLTHIDAPFGKARASLTPSRAPQITAPLAARLPSPLRAE